MRKTWEGESITRRTCITAVGAALVAGSILSAKEGDTMREVLEAAQNEKKSVTLYLKSQNIGGAVVKAGQETVELHNREFGRSSYALTRLTLWRCRKETPWD